MSTASATNSGDASDESRCSGRAQSGLKDTDCRCLASAMLWLDTNFVPLRGEEAKVMRALTTESFDAQRQAKMRPRVTHGRLAKSSNALLRYGC